VELQAPVSCGDLIPISNCARLCIIMYIAGSRHSVDLFELCLRVYEIYPTSPHEASLTPRGFMYLRFRIAVLELKGTPQVADIMKNDTSKMNEFETQSSFA
jgi:hypothetical protein